jgi:hypothetical protein
MRENLSFLDILVSKIQSQNASADTLNTNLNQHIKTYGETEYEPMAWLLGNIPKSSPLPAQTHYWTKAYNIKPRQKPEHLLSEVQHEAWIRLSQYDSSLGKCFTKQELKSLHRQRLKKCHPDHGGTAQDFFQAQEDFKCLIVLFEKNAKTTAAV